MHSRAAGAFRKGGPQTEVGSSLSSDTYTDSSEPEIIKALDDNVGLKLRPRIVCVGLHHPSARN